MRFDRIQKGLLPIMVGLCMLICALSGCTIVGPTSIKTGRMDYNEAITRTEAQQMLMMVVRTRYGEASSPLAVSSITANFSVQANAGINLGFGPTGNYATNLVPFSSNMMYEENPTISYTPIQGKQAIRQLLSPIPLDALVLLARSMASSDLPWTLLVRRVNDLENPDFLYSSSAKPDFRFARFVELMTMLGKAGRLCWVEEAQGKIRDAVVIRKYSPSQWADVQELLALLGAPEPAGLGKDIVLPLSLAVGEPPPGEVAIETRSVYDLAEILAGSVDVPSEDLNAGRAVKYPPSGLAGKDLRIRRSASSPDDALVAVKFRGYWFYIADTDVPTKATFRLLQVLWSARVAELAAQQQLAPVLTVPVGK